MSDRPGRVESGWDREWAYVQERANAPRTPMLGCSTISHDRLGFCAACVRALRDGGPNGADLEIAAWRLRALEPATTMIAPARTPSSEAPHAP
jgi:hypothetical protein